VPAIFALESHPRWELLLSIVEISRRGVWNILRVEHRQHQLSTGKAAKEKVFEVEVEMGERGTEPRIAK
jgi:hypothetical protein